MTTKIAEFDRQNLSTLRSDIAEALAAIAEKHGIELKLSKIGYTDNSFTAKIEGATIGENGESANSEAAEFRMLAAQYGLKPEDLGRSFMLKGREAKIIGLNSRATKMPILIDHAGKRVKISAEYVGMLLGNRR